MKKITTLASAAALAVTFAVPATADTDTSNTTSDPFVSSQASIGLLGLGAAGTVVVTTAIVATVVAVANAANSTN